MLLHTRWQRLLAPTILGATAVILLVAFHDQAIATAKQKLSLPAFGSSTSHNVIDSDSPGTGPAGSKDSQANHELSFLEQQGEFWRQFHIDLTDYAPKVDSLIHPEDSHLDIGWKEGAHRDRPDLLVMTRNQRKELQNAHSGFVQKIKEQTYSVPYKKSTRGIVTTAGGPYLIVALVSIRMLRQTGSNLPVEVFLANRDEWDNEMCNNVFPSLGAKCVVFTDIFDQVDSGKKVSIEKYQLKVMSILLSSFEEVLFLDADCFPIYNPDPLFDNKPFTDTGLILWPDFWYPSESPLFFDITGIAEPDISKRPSTESGEMMYSKKKHELSLLLAAYYNYHGPNYYYPLQSQGAPGEGDKETFLWSAIALGKPLRSVRHRVVALGYETKSGEWRGSAMAQFDPIEDSMPAREDAYGARKGIYPRPFFLHVNFPKIDPARIFDDDSFGASGPTRDSDGSKRRIWHDSAEIAENFFGFDVERSMWGVVKDIACRYEKTFDAWRFQADVCKRAVEYWDAVFEGK